MVVLMGRLAGKQSKTSNIPPLQTLMTLSTGALYSTSPNRTNPPYVFGPRKHEINIQLYCDISQAFNRVWHRGLLDKL